MRKRLRFFGVSLMLILISCQYDPYAHNYTIEEPKDLDLVGIYIFEKQTVDFDMSEFKDTANNQIVIPKIEIMSDGTYKVENLPVFENWNPVYKGLMTNSGQWNKTTVGSVEDGSGELKDHWGIHFDKLPEDSQNAGLMNNVHPYHLILGYGDPDEGNVMIFYKEIKTDSEK